MKAIARRLQKLEKKFPPLVLACAGPSATEYIAEFLVRKGIALGLPARLLPAPEDKHPVREASLAGCGTPDRCKGVGMG